MSFIDERVVKMVFDSAKFEKGIAKTMSLLDKFQDALMLKGASAGLDNLQKSFNRFDLTGLSSAVDTVSDRFTTLGIIGTTALIKITNQAIDAGERLLKSLTVDQVAAGWQKFADKTSAVGTLVSQGNELEFVNDQMDRLNWFTDETSYNFTDMANNIAKFTATGKGLEESVTMMQGIALWAAASGQNAGTASRAMYQLSQAMGSGVMRKEDWKSIQNTSMDTDEFRQVALDTAVALGKLKKTGEDTYQSLQSKSKAGAAEFKKAQFADSLTEGAWFDAEVMEAVYKKYGSASEVIREFVETNDQGIETASEAIEAIEARDKAIIESYSKENNLSIEDATKALVEQEKILDPVAIKWFKAGQEARSFADVIDSVKDAVSTQFMNMFQKIFGNYEEAKTLWTDLANELWEMFAGPLQQVNDLLDVWNKLGGRTHFLDALKNGWEAILALTDPIKEAFSNIFPNEMKAGKLYQITKKFEEFTDKLKINDGIAMRIRRTFEGVFSIFDLVGQAVSAVGRTLGNFLPVIGDFASEFLRGTSKVGLFIKNMAEAAKENDFFYNKIQQLIEFVRPAIETVVNVLENAVQAFENFTGIDLHIPTWTEFTTALGNIKIKLEPVTSVLKSGAESIHNFFESLNQAQSQGGEKKIGIFQKIGEVIGKLAKILGPILTSVKNAFGQFLDYFSKALDNVDGNKITGLLGGGLFAFIGLKIKDFIDNIKDKLKPLDDIKHALSDLKDSLLDTFGAIQDNLKAGMLLKIAVAIGILAGSLILLAGKNDGELARGLAAIGGLMGELLVFLSIFEIIGKLDPESSFKSIGKVSGALVKLSIAVLILSKAMSSLAKLGWEEIAKGLVTVGGLLLELGIFATALNGYAGGVENASKGMIQMAAAILVLSLASKVFATMKWEEIGKGLVGVGGLLLELGLFARLAGGAKHLLSTGVAMVAVAAALTVLTGVLFVMGKASESMGSGLLILAGLLFELATALYFMEGSLAGAAAMFVAAAAITVLTPALLLLGTVMTGDAIARALITLAGALLVMGVAAAAMGTAGPTILLGALALGAFSAAVLLAGAALAAFGVGLTVFAASIVAAGSTVIAGVGVIGQALELAVTLLINAIKGMIEQAVMLIPFIVELALMLVDGFLAGIARHLPSIIASGAAIVLAILTGITTYLPAILQAGIELMVTFIDGLANGIRDNTDKILRAMSNLMSSLVELVLTAVQGLVKNIPGIGGELAKMLEDAKTTVRETLAPDEFEDMAKDAGNSISTGLEAANTDIRAAGEEAGKGYGEAVGEQTSAVEGGAKSLTDVLQNGLGGSDVLSMLNDTGETDVESWVKGSELKADDMMDIFNSIGGDASKNLGNDDGKFTTAGDDAVLGFIAGMGNHDGEVKAEGIRISNIALSAMTSKEGLDEHSPSKKTYKIGIHGGKGFIIGLKDSEAGAKKAGEELGDAAAEGLEKSVDAQVGIVDFAGKAIEEFTNKWSATQEWDEDADAIQYATDSLEALALQLYETSLATEDAEKKAKRAAKTEVELLQDVKEAFIKTRDDFKKNLDGQIDMFKMFDFGESVKSGDMIKRFESNLNAMTEFSDSLEALAERGIDRGLLQNIAKRGPSALGEIKAFLKATDDEFAKLNEDWVKQGEILEEVSDRYMSTLAYAMGGGEEAFTHVLDPETGEETGKTFLEATLAGMRESVGLNLQEFEAVGEIAAEAVGNGLEKASSNSSSTKKKSKDAATSITDTVVDTVDNNVKKEDGSVIGYRLCEGIAEGLRSGIEIATTAAEELAVSIIAKVKEVFDEHSPSRVFSDIGYYADAGLANGFVNNGRIVRTAAAEAALGAVDELSGVFGRIADIVDGQIDLDPTIRPVLDLSEIQYGAGQIGSLLGLNDPYALNATATIAGIQNDATMFASMTDSLKNAIRGLKVDGESQPVTINIYPQPNQSAEEIANYVAWKFNHDLNKRRAAYGGT